MVRALKTGKNPELARGIRKFGKTHFRKQKLAKKPVAKSAPKTKKFNGKDIVVGKNKGVPRQFTPNAPSLRPRVAGKKPRVVHKAKPAKPATALRASITPGTVLIVLAGQFRGKRVVFLKQLLSGLLLVTGPYALNGVPLRRLSQAYVIATSTKVDISSIKLDEKLNDAFFAAKKTEKQPGLDRFFGVRRPRVKTELSAERKALQKSTDAALLSLINKVDLLGPYLKSIFSLKKGQYPHALRF